MSMGLRTEVKDLLDIVHRGKATHMYLHVLDVFTK
jgi:hypothetical protein